MTNLTSIEIVSTGIMSGAQITINGGDATKFDIAAGTAYLVDVSNIRNITKTVYSWDAIIGVQSDFYTTNEGSFMAIDPSLGSPITSANVVQRVADFKIPTDLCNLFRVGRLRHPVVSGAIVSTFDFPVYPTGNLDWVSQHISKGTIKSDGLQVTASRNSYIEFSADLITGNAIDGDSGIFSIVTVNFTTNHLTTMGLIATAIETANANIEEAVIDPDDATNRTIKITTNDGVAEQGVLNWVVTGGDSQATVTETDALLSLNISEGTTIRIGAAYDIDNDTSLRCALNFPNTNEIDRSSMIPAYTNGAGTGTTTGTPSTQIDPTQYDGGAGSLVATGNNQFINIYVLFFPYHDITTIFHVYGKSDYGTLEIAKAAVASPADLKIQDDISGGVILCAVSVKKETTNLTADLIGGTAFITNTDKEGEF